MKFIGYDKEGFAVYEVVEQTGYLTSCKERDERKEIQEQNFNDFEI